MSRALFLLALLGAAVSAAAAAEPFRSERIAVTVRGSGPDVILIPGLAAPASIWNATAAAVPGYRYHFVQVAGFAGAAPRGNSAGPVVAPVAAEIARYATLVRRAKGGARPALVGHSMGGTLAMMVASSRPDAARAVMVVDMVPAPASLFGLSASSARPLAATLRADIGNADRLRRAAASVIGRFGSASWLQTRSDAGLVGRAVEELLATDLRPSVARIGSPLTIVYACPDPVPLTCPAIRRLYARAYANRPGARLVAVERSGHNVMADQPAFFRHALRGFLGRGSSAVQERAPNRGG